MIRLLIPLVVVVALGAVLYAGLDEDPSIIPSPLIDRPAPAYDLPTLADPNKTIGTAKLAGTAYVLNVWASWCPGCRVEHNVVTNLAQREIVPVVGLNWKDEPGDARRWLAQFGDPYDAIAVDESGRVGIDFGVYGAPETYVIDSDGIIRFKHIGVITPQLVDDVIVPLLNTLRTAPAS